MEPPLNPGQAHNGSDRREGNRRTSDNAEPLTVTIEPKAKQKYSYNAKQYRLDRTRYRLEKKAYCVACWTMIFLVFYTTITGIIAVYSIRSSDAAKKASNTAAASFEAEHRAWIRPVYDPKSQPVIPDAVYREPFDIENVGKGLAGSITGFVVVQLLDSDQPPDFQYTDGHLRNSIEAGLLYPTLFGNIATPITLMDRGAKEPVEHKTTLAEVQEFNAGDKWIALHGRIDYTDLTSGKRHWVTFCNPRFVTAWKMKISRQVGDTCSNWNKIDQN